MLSYAADVLILNKIRAFGSTDCFNGSTDCFNGSTDYFNGTTDYYTVLTDCFTDLTDDFTDLTEQKNKLIDPNKGFSGLISDFMAQYKRIKKQNFAPTKTYFVGAFLREG